MSPFGKGVAFTILGVSLLREFVTVHVSVLALT